MVIKLFFRYVVVLYMFTATRLCYGDTNKLPSSQDKVEEVLKRLNKPPVKSINSPDGDIIDCVHIYHQPAFDHPLLKNHTIKMEPDNYPTSISVDDIKTSSMMNVAKDERSSSSITQLWHSSGTCPKGTIPIRRTTKEDVLRANSVKNNYGNKKGHSIHRRQSVIDTELDDVFTGFGFGTAYVDHGKLYGTQAKLNIWNPKIGESHEYSMAKIWIVGSMPDDNTIDDINTIEAGWQVYPQAYGDANTRLFIYWTADGYQNTGCCNLDCSGFIQTSNKVVLGGTISPTSQTNGSQIVMNILIWKDPNSDTWWMQLNGENIGYWPLKLFSHLRDGASLIEWGGVVANRGSNGYHTTTQMGSGEFPQQWFGKASYIRNIETVDASNTFRTPGSGDLKTANENGCYDILVGTNDKNWGTYLFYGGPGRNKNCQ